MTTEAKENKWTYPQFQNKQWSRLWKKLNEFPNEWMTIFIRGMLAAITNKPWVFESSNTKDVYFFQVTFTMLVPSWQMILHTMIQTCTFLPSGSSAIPRPWSHLYPAGTRGERQHRKGIMTSEKPWFIRHHFHFPTGKN